MTKQFNKLLISQLFFSLGNTVYTVSIISSVLTSTHSVLATSIMPLAMTLGTVLCGLVTPMLVARYRMIKVLKVTQFLGIILFIMLSMSLQFGEMTILALSIWVCLFSLLTSFMYPLSVALIPALVEKEYLIKANSLYNTMGQLVNILSWLVGASLVVLFQQTTLLMIDTLLFIMSFLCLIGIYANRVDDNKKTTNLWKEFKKGWFVIRDEPLVKVVLLMDSLESIANTAWVSSIVLVYVTDFLHKGDQWWGYINATFFLGSMMGSLLVMKNETTINQQKARFIFFGSLMGSVITFLFAIIPLPIVSLILSIGVGFFSQMKNIPQVTVIQQKISSEKIASVYSASSVLCSLIFSLSLILSSIVSDNLGVNMVFIISSLCLLVVTYITKKYVKYFV